MIHIQIQHSLLVPVNKLLQIVLQSFIGSCIWNVIKLLQRILSGIVVVTHNSHASLMVSPVHIPIYKKIHIPTVCHRQNRDIMLPVIIAGIRYITASKGKDPCSPLLLLIIAPQIPVCPVSQNVSIWTFFDLNPLISGDSKQNPFSRVICLLSLKNLVYLPIIIHQINPKGIPFHSKIFFYLIIFCLVLSVFSFRQIR